VTPDGRRVVSASRDHTLKVWDLETGAETATLTGHTDWVNGCAVNPDGRRVVSASEDGTLKVWDLETGAETATLTGHTGPVSGCAVSPDGRHIVSVSGSILGASSGDHTLRVWDLETGAETASLPLAGPVMSVAVHPARPLVACGDRGGSVMVAELIGIEYGPLVVTAIDHGQGPVLRCPACQGEHPLDEAWLGQVIDCRAGCGTRLCVNPFVACP
jgi:WD40 repeat protein